MFKAAVEGIKAAKKAGFLVCTNTTIYKETDLDEIDRLFAYLTKLGWTASCCRRPTATRRSSETNPDGAAEIFLTRDDIRAKFQEAEKLLRKYRMMSSPIYLEFLSGKRELTCTAWGNPTRNVKGWKGPCYLITDEHHETLRGPDGQHRLGAATATARTRAASTAWSTAATSRRRRWASTAAGRQPQDADVAIVLKTKG